MQVERLLSHCPTLPASEEESCVLDDRSLSGVVALGVFATQSNSKVWHVCATNISVEVTLHVCVRQ